MELVAYAAGQALKFCDWLFLYFFIAQNLFMLALLFLGGYGALRFAQTTRQEMGSVLAFSEILPPISVLVPAYNEERTIVDSVRSILSLNYPHFDIIVVNDGSSDGTVEALRKAFKLYPVIPLYDESIPTTPVRSIYRSRAFRNLTVVDKANGGKSDALNCAMNLAASPVICCVDADTLVEEHALLRMIRPFLMAPADVAAVGGTIRVANGCHIESGRLERIGLPDSWLVRIQIVEYIRSFLFGRMGWNPLGGPLIVSGAFGLFRKDLVIASGGYRRETVGEDMDLVMSLHNLPRRGGGKYSVIFVPDTVSWTQVPSDTGTLGRQRERWQMGQTESLIHHRRMLFSPRHGLIGMVGIPFTFFGEMLAPLFEILGYAGIAAGYALGVVDLPFAFLFFTVAWGFSLMLSCCAILLEELSFHRYAFADVVKLIIAAGLEGFGFRQMNLWWRLKGLYRFITGKRGWGRMKRQSFGESAVLTS